MAASNLGGNQWFVFIKLMEHLTFILNVAGSNLKKLLASLMRYVLAFG